MRYDVGMSNLPTINFPKFELPKFELPKLDLPDVDLPGPEQVLGAVRDAAYAGVGLVALTAERVGELQAAFRSAVTDAVDVVKEQVGSRLGR